MTPLKSTVATFTTLAIAIVSVSMSSAFAHGGVDHGDMKHGGAMAKSGYERTTADYKVPALKLIGTDGQPQFLPTALDQNKPVMLNFVFTTCGGICPMMSATFSQVQKQLGADSSKLQMVSISIDPEHDTPAVLMDYAKKFSAGPQWQFMTGSAENSIAVQRAFDMYRGDKMNHTPVTFLRAGEGKPWVRIEGDANAADLVREIRQLAQK
ncbi:MAG: SCO family protein [Burkholderiales bacterium]